MNNASRWIANRLKLSGTENDNISAGALIAVIGVALAVVVMEITLCVVSGFKSEIQNKIIGFDSQITIGRPYDYSTGLQDDFITLSDSLKSALQDGNAMTQPSLAVTLPAMLKTDDNFSGALFVGHDNAHNFDFEINNITSGNFPDYRNDSTENAIVISQTVANDLNLRVGARLFAFFFVDNALKSRRVTVSGIYESNLTEYDKVIAYSSLPFLQNVIGVDSLTGTHVEVSGLKIEEIDNTGQKLQNKLMDAMQTGSLDKLYPVTTVKQTGAIYFNWLSLLDTNVIVIFVLMMAVALFTLVSNLFLMILDRIPTIGLLKSLGTNNAMLSEIFLNMGLRLAVKGIIIGNIVGIAICLLQLHTGFIKLDPKMYYLTEVPVRIDVLPLIILNVAVLIISFLVLYFPAKSAAKIDPTKTMRYE